jgi:hypothetical protein
MDIDINALARGIALLNSAISAVKKAKDLLPDSSQKADATAQLEQAERQFKNAEAETAKALGYQICHNHFPPEVMLSEDEMLWECPKCGNKKDYRVAGFVR